MEKILEQKASELIMSLLEKWKPEFDKYSYIFDDITINRSGENHKYFSEIETYVWKKNNLEDVFNLILYMEGKQIIGINEIELEANKEFERIYSKIKDRIN